MHSQPFWASPITPCITYVHPLSQATPLPDTHLIVHRVDALLALAVHVEDLQERLVHAVIVRKAGLCTKQVTTECAQTMGY